MPAIAPLSSPPQSQEQLLAQARQLAGYTLGELAARRVGAPLLWSPDEEEERQLRMDWEELMDLIVLGEVERITARHGEVLQLRPKAANSKALTEAIGAHGETILTLPRGFYLKKNFTAALLARHFLLQHD
ncbi:hypothetical protein MMC50_003613 [Klebsiella quasipneumoniae]|uniref:hypothetical protein n=1 Tax=Klebsiella quasipneumoniae TaxID=1463165 RepID=UPI002A5931D8|nr:hypothetical protein [Klebsiella quasipneumoniae]EKX7756023.1 hypothetical protein [Klebsiella quasipneumoniae]